MGLRSSWAVLSLVLFLLSSNAFAENGGLEKLDEATNLKLDAETPADLAKVMELCEQAIEAGLDEGNERLAKQILAGTALQRAQLLLQQLPRAASNPNALRNLRRQMVSDLEKAIENNPQLAEAMIMMAKLEVLPGGSHAKAREYLTRAIEALKNKPVDQAEVYLLRAGLQEDNETRLADISKAVELDGTNVDAMRAKIELQLRLGKMEDVFSDAKRLLEKDSGDMIAFEAAVRALVGLERIDEAIKLLSEQIDKDGSKGSLYRWRATAKMIKEDSEGAMADLNKAIEIDPRDYEALVTRGQLHYDNGDIEKANRDINDSLLIEPNSVQGILMRSIVAAEERRFSDAISDMEMLVRADPGNVGWIMQLANLYQMDERPRLAIRVLDSLIAKEPDNWRAMRIRGDAYLTINGHKEAIADYEKAVAILEEKREVATEEQATDLDFSGVLNNLSWVLSTSQKDELRDGNKALDYALKACEATEYKAAHILSTLAAAYAELGDFEKAREWSSKSIELAEAEDHDQLEQLKKELESYKENKPWREEQKTEENAKPVAPATETIDT